jgi:T6SS immunity protein Tdi1, C-terminal
MNIRDYLIDQTGLDWEALLEEWHWLLPPEFRVWMLTRVGDLFITLPDGSVQMLDVGAGRLQRVAQSRDEFCAKIDEPGVADDWLMIPIVDQLVVSGAVLGLGECYSFRQLPVLGGTYKADNRMVFPIREHFGAWGSVQRQISDLPDGSHVVIKPVA